MVVLANLKSRNMAGVASHGMLLCASDDSHEKVELLVCPEGAVPGERIKFGAWDAEQAEAHTENQMKKKKTWEKVAPDLRTTDACGAAYKDLPMVTSAGAVACASIAGAPPALGPGRRRSCHERTTREGHLAIGDARKLLSRSVCCDRCRVCAVQRSLPEPLGRVLLD